VVTSRVTTVFATPRRFYLTESSAARSTSRFLTSGLFTSGSAGLAASSLRLTTGTNPGQETRTASWLTCGFASRFACRLFASGLLASGGTCAAEEQISPSRIQAEHSHQGPKGHQAKQCHALHVNTLRSLEELKQHLTQFSYPNTFWPLFFIVHCKAPFYLIVAVRPFNWPEKMEICAG